MRTIFAFMIGLFTLSSCQDIQPVFVDVESPTGEYSSLSRLVTDEEGSVHMTWVKTIQDTAQLYYSIFDGNIWSEKELLKESANWFVNWADFPSLAVSNQQLVAINTLPKSSGGTYSYNVELTAYQDEATNSFLAHNDNTFSEHGFVSMQATSDSTFYAIWLDGRNTTGHGHDAHDGGHSDLSTAMTLRGGEFHVNGSQLSDDLIDDSVCDCCNTTLAQGPNGLIAAYRNRTEDEIRDIYVSRRIDGEWTEPKATSLDEWQIQACPVNGAQLSSFGNTVALAWFTAANDENKVKLAFSMDGGESFGQAITIDAYEPIGRVDVEMTESGSAWVSWISEADDDLNSELMLRRVSPEGEFLYSASIADMKGTRRSGFPQMSRFKDGLLFSWTHLDEDDRPQILIQSLEF